MSISPHGGELVQALCPPEALKQWEGKLSSLPKLTISNRIAIDCELLANGGLSPLKGFMTQDQAVSVMDTMRLPNGLLWSIPLLLPVAGDFFQQAEPGQTIVLEDETHTPMAILAVSDKFTLDLNALCEKVYQTTDPAHPGVAATVQQGNQFIGGEIQALLNPPQYDNIASQYLLSPKTVRALIEKKGWRTCVAFQTRNPIHRAHEYLIKCALEMTDGALIHPLVGETKSDDIPADVRMHCYETLIEHYFNPEHILLSALPANMHYAGPREAIHHLIMRQNFGCSHMIIGRDHAGVGNYYGTYDAQRLVEQYTQDLKITPLMFDHAVYSKRCESMISVKTGPQLPEDAVFLSGTKVRDMLAAGQRPPKEFTRPEVADILIEWAAKTPVATV